MKYLVTIDAFGKHLGHIATLDDLTDAKLGGFMRELKRRKLSVATVNGYRSKIIALWRNGVMAAPHQSAVSL